MSVDAYKNVVFDNRIEDIKIPQINKEEHYSEGPVGSS